MTTTSWEIDLTDEGQEDDIHWRELVRHRLPRYAKSKPLTENVRRLARSSWGSARADWVICLAQELIDARPDAARGDFREWAAAILWAAAVDTRMDRDPRLWEHFVEDIVLFTAVPADRARAKFEELADLGLSRPRNPPPYWLD